MCNELEDLVKNNPSVTLHDYVWAHMKALLVKWEWIKESDPIPTSVSVSPEQEQSLAETRKLVQKKLDMSDEEARKGYEKYCEEQRLIGARSKELLAQAEAWKLPCEDQTLRDQTLKELHEAVEHAEPANVTIEQFKRMNIRIAIEQLDMAERHYRHNVRAARNVNDTLTALRNTLGDPPASTSTAG